MNRKRKINGILNQDIKKINFQAAVLQATKKGNE